MATACPTHSFVTSNKGKALLVIDDYVFQQSGKATIATTYWACQFKNCSAVAHTTTKTVVLTKQKNDHCHAPVPEKIEIRHMMNKVKSRVINETTFKLEAGSQNKNAPKTLAMQEQIDNLGTRFYNDDIDRTELLEGLSLLVASKK